MQEGMAVQSAIDAFPSFPPFYILQKADTSDWKSDLIYNFLSSQLNLAARSLHYYCGTAKKTSSPTRYANLYGTLLLQNVSR